MTMLTPKKLYARYIELLVINIISKLREKSIVYYYVGQNNKSTLTSGLSASSVLDVVCVNVMLKSRTIPGEISADG